MEFFTQRERGWKAGFINIIVSYFYSQDFTISGQTKQKSEKKKTLKGKECISWKTLHEPSHQHENRIGPIIFIFLFLSMYSFLSSLHQDAGLLFFYDHKKVKTNRKEWVAIHATAFQNFRSIIGLTNNENFSYGDMTSYKYKYWKLFSLGFVSLR